MGGRAFKKFCHQGFDVGFDDRSVFILCEYMEVHIIGIIDRAGEFLESGGAFDILFECFQIVCLNFRVGKRIHKLIHDAVCINGIQIMT